LVIPPLSLAGDHFVAVEAGFERFAAGVGGGQARDAAKAVVDDALMRHPPRFRTSTPSDPSCDAEFLR
jgi:hypothetical protein